jgi:thiamine phosphate synthase YjbQ (UPF0047 family)
MHITASVFINDDADPGASCTTARAKLASGKPLSWTKGQFADAALKRNATRSVARDGPRRAAVVAVTHGCQDLGTWERIFYGEFDGRRRKRVLVKIIGE